VQKCPKIETGCRNIKIMQKILFYWWKNRKICETRNFATSIIGNWNPYLFFLLSSSSFWEGEGSAPKYGEQSKAFTWDAMRL
jgi:hypothetical protein